MTKTYDLSRPRRPALGPPGTQPPAIQPQAQHVPPPQAGRPMQPRPTHDAAAPAPAAKVKRSVPWRPPGVQKRQPVTSVRLKEHVRAALALVAQAMGTSVSDYLSTAIMRDYANMLPVIKRL